VAIYRIIMRILDVVARLGFEPRQTESEVGQIQFIGFIPKIAFPKCKSNKCDNNNVLLE